MTGIDIKNIDVHFPIYDARARSFRHSLLGMGTGRIGATESHHVVVRALNDISLSLSHGDRLGLVGRNGAGKSTLLRVMTGTYEPGAGSVRIEGRLAALTDLTMGMDMEGTGYENILIRGLMLGLTRRQSLDRVGEVEAFTELGDYLNLPLRTYSSGMGLRLAFAISTCVEPEILLLDEVIGAGDTHFMEKAEQRLAEMTDRAKILVIASHAVSKIMTLCNKALLLHEGQVLGFGPAEAILERYKAMG